jgi:hypothetical protein
MVTVRILHTSAVYRIAAVRAANMHNTEQKFPNCLPWFNGISNKSIVMTCNGGIRYLKRLYGYVTPWVENFFFLVSLGGVRLCLHGTSATVGLLYQPLMIDDDCVAGGGMRIGRGNRSTRRNLPQCHFVHHKSHMTWPGIEPWPPRWEASD